MNQITIDNPLTMQLHSLVEPVELVDTDSSRSPIDRVLRRPRS